MGHIRDGIFSRVTPLGRNLSRSAPPPPNTPLASPSHERLVDGVHGHDDGGGGLFPFPRALLPTVGSLVDTRMRVVSSPVPVEVCSDDFSLLGMVQRAVVVASSVGCVAPLRGALAASMAGLRRHPSRCGRPPWRWCMVRYVHVAASTTEGARHCQHLSRRGMVSLPSLLISVVVVVGRVGRRWHSWSGLQESRRPWWMPTAGGRSSWSWFGGRGLSVGGGMGEPALRFPLRHGQQS
jgi:hypothetical protein